MTPTELPVDWQMSRLAEICESDAPIMYGILQPGPEIEGGVPYVRPTEIDEDRIRLEDIKRTTHEISECYRRSKLRAGDLLITIVGTLGKIAVVPSELEGGNITQSSARIRIDSKQADTRYVRQFLRSNIALRQYEACRLGTGVPRLNIHHVRDLALPLPPLATQRRIADVLDRAEALRAKRRAALDELDHLAAGILVDLFRDANAHDWPEPSVESLAIHAPNAIRTGPFGSQLLHSEFVESGIAVLGIDNVVNNKFTWGLPRFVTDDKYRELKRYTVHPGDILITIMGTCGRCAIVPNDIPTAINTKHLCCVTLDHSRCLPIYFQACFLAHPKVQHHLGVRERGAVMPGLNMQIIKELQIPLPPMQLQEEFARRVAAVEKLKATHRASLAELDSLFASLQHRAFRGEL